MKLFVEKDTQKIEEEFISAKEAAREFGYNPDYVARLCRKGKFESRRQDRQWYVNRAAAQTFFIAHAERIRKHRNELSRELSAVEIHMPFSGSQELVWHDGLTDYDLRMRVAPRSLRALLALKTRTSHTHALAHSLLNKKTVVGVVVLFLCVFALTSNVSSISTRIPPNVFTAAATSASGSWISQTLCSYFSLCSDSGAALTRAARDRAYEPVIVIEKSKAAAPAVSVQSAPSSVARVVQNITQPVIERIIERASASPLAGSFITDALLVSRLGDLETRLNQRISSIPGPMSGGGSSAPVYINTFGLSQKIDQLDSVTITNPTISGGSVVATSLNGLLGIGNGGTGTTTFTQGWIYSDGGTNTLAASTSPTVLAIIATSTSVASQLPYASSTALTVSGTAYFPAGIWNATGNVGIGTTSPYARLSVAGEAVAAYVSATSTTATSTFAGGILGTRAPTLPHTFSSWLTGASNAQALTAALVVNPASAVADSNLISASVGDSVRFLIDAEGDIFVNNITSVGSVTLSTTSASTFTVEGNTTLGDAITDVTTVNGTLTVAGTTTVASVAGKFGVGSTTPLAKLSVHANDGETNTTLFAVASSTASATTTLFSISNTGAITSTAGSAHTLPYASSTALTISGTASTSNLTVSNTTQLSNNLTGPLQAIGGLVSASSSLSAFYGGTGITSPSAAQILLGSYTGGGWQQLATSSLGLLTTNVTEGTNLYYTDARVQSFVHASSTIPKTYTNNTFTGSNIFSIATTTGKLSSYSFVETPYFNATSTTASQLPYASTTAVTAT
ncbi:helix-turn-helix domain-containing protein, partial [Candidatus Kaiserbacteria bacterium]|nr:helix-turn-helix domain-containing protein [Candidatus Kaiserbacteria bacterium]